MCLVMKNFLGEHTMINDVEKSWDVEIETDEI